MKMKNYLIVATAGLLLTACAGSPIIDETINEQASLPSDFNFTSKGFKVMSTLISKKKETMATLYGNDIALRSVKAGTRRHAAGLVMALVTWRQRGNAYWYGNRIPGRLLSLEILTADKTTGKITYALFEGEKLVFNPEISGPEKRISDILDIKPSVMP